MANDARPISNLSVITTVSANDRVVVLVNPSTTANVVTITANNLGSSISPYIHLNYANSTTAGIIKVGSTLTINATGYLDYDAPVANTISFGVVKVGNTLTINTTGYLDYKSPLEIGRAHV